MNSCHFNKKCLISMTDGLCKGKLITVGIFATLVVVSGNAFIEVIVHAWL